MKKLLLSVLAMSFLSGCVYQSLTGVDIQKASKYCLGLVNIQEVTSNFLGEERVSCTDTSKAILSKVSLDLK